MCSDMLTIKDKIRQEYTTWQGTSTISTRTLVTEKPPSGTMSTGDSWPQIRIENAIYIVPNADVVILGCDSPMETIASMAIQHPKEILYCTYIHTL